ncbi:MAG: methionyl-tRNA formyltransferase, partial [Woeseia sp.]
EAIPVRQPATLRDADVQAELAAFEPDLIIVAAYGLLLPQAVLGIPRLGCVNVHASLLPRWRGAAPIQAALLAGDAETGISLMRMDAGLDSGPVHARRAIRIGAADTAGSLHDRLAELGGVLLCESLPDLLEGRLEAVPQDAARVTHAGKFSPADAVLDWARPAAALERQVRAFNPVPGARFDIDDETIKCWRASVRRCDGHTPGHVLDAGRHGIDIACGGDALRLLEVQRPGKRRIRAAELAAQLPLAGRTLITMAP